MIGKMSVYFSDKIRHNERKGTIVIGEYNNEK